MSEVIYSWFIRRLSSFLRYPEFAIVRPPTLARLGFYSSGIGEQVTCFRCGVTHTRFQRRQDILREHRLRSPLCPLIANGEVLQGDDANAVGNYVPQVVPDLLPNEIRFVDEPIRLYSSELQRRIEFIRSDPDFRLLRAVGISLRRFSFFDWPGRHADREPLALCGLFYTGTLLEVRCCVCLITYRFTELESVLRFRQCWCSSSCRRYF